MMMGDMKMLKTELEFRKNNEELFLQYLKGIRTSAYKDKEAARRQWEKMTPLSNVELPVYAKYARKDERVRLLQQVIDAYERIINGGIIDEKDPLFK